MRFWGGAEEAVVSVGVLLAAAGLRFWGGAMEAGDAFGLGETAAAAAAA